MAFQAILVSSNRLLREGIRRLLEKTQFDVIGEGREISELREALDGGRYPDLAIFHLGFDQTGEAALEIVRNLREHFPETKLVVLADACAKSALPPIVRAGASAVLMTEISGGMLERSLELVLSDHRLFPADVMSMVTGTPSSGVSRTADAPSVEMSAANGRDGLAVGLVDGFAADHDVTPALSKRECQVVRCLAVGLSNKIIARELKITEGTVKVHIKGLLRKVRASNRTQLAIWALRQANLTGDDFGSATRPEAKHAA